MVRLDTPTEGAILFEGTNIAQLRDHELRRFRREIQIIFQNPMSSLNPRMTVGNMLTEPLRLHKMGDRAACQRRVHELLELVGLKARALRSLSARVFRGAKAAYRYRSGSCLEIQSWSFAMSRFRLWTFLFSRRSSTF